MGVAMERIHLKTANIANDVILLFCSTSTVVLPLAESVDISVKSELQRKMVSASFGLFEDSTSLALLGTLISLNISVGDEPASVTELAGFCHVL